MKKILIVLVLMLVGCTDGDSIDYSEYADLPYSKYINEENPEVTIVFSDDTEIVIQLFPEVAPNTVNNFIYLSYFDFYDNLIFHRIIEDFMIQGGDPEGTGTGGSDYEINGEFSKNGFSNDLSHYRGTISMARSAVMDSASSQFFIVHQDSSGLDGSYATFGGILKGFDVLDNIAETKTGDNDRPVNYIVIKDVIINLKGKTYPEPEKIININEDYFLPERYMTNSNPEVTINFDNGMHITLELFPEIAPLTVENFLSLAEDGFYDEVIMHRIIKGFMIQGGDPDGTGYGGSDTTVKGEFKNNNVSNPLSHVRGVISMARGGNDNNSASSQFFIVHSDSAFLNGDYAAFGVITDGLDTLDEIANVETDTGDKPLEDITITSIEIKK